MCVSSRSLLVRRESVLRPCRWKTAPLPATTRHHHHHRVCTRFAGFWRAHTETYQQSFVKFKHHTSISLWPVRHSNDSSSCLSHISLPVVCHFLSDADLLLHCLSISFSLIRGFLYPVLLLPTLLLVICSYQFVWHVRTTVVCVSDFFCTSGVSESL